MCSELSEMKLQKEDIKIMTPEKHLEILETAPADDTPGLRIQLEKCRAALRIQTQRSRQLVAAYTTKLRDKENSLRETERRCDSRLANIVRALIALEANMKREQKSIKSQLVDKDKIITEQRRIISALMKNTTSTESSPLSSQNSSLNSSNSSTEIVTTKQTLSVFENTINIDDKIEKENVPVNTKEKPVKPPKPPKPHTPYKPILKLSLARPAIKKETDMRTRRANSEVCLLLAPTRNAPSTHLMHPSEDGNDANNKMTSPHRVSRMVQRFEPRTNGRSLSCTALTSLKLSTLNPVDFSDKLDCKDTSNSADESAELYSLSSNDDKVSEISVENEKNTSQCYNSDTTQYQNIDTLSGNFEEFHLDSESSSEPEEENVHRKDGDGAENLVNQSNNNKVATSYEGFLEATGLSQKSILTPSRLLASTIANNPHRSVLKPRHVKFRSKANRAFATPTVKYWSGPFL